MRKTEINIKLSQIITNEEVTEESVEDMTKYLIEMMKNDYLADEIDVEYDVELNNLVN